MNFLIKILSGLGILSSAILAWGFNFWEFGEAAINFFRGGLIWIVIFIGIILIILGISELKD
jgi:hypothetical protein